MKVNLQKSLGFYKKDSILVDLKAIGIIQEEEEDTPSQNDLFIPLRDNMNEADSEIDKTENLLNPSSNQARMYRSSTMNFTHSFNRENPLIDNN